MDFKSEWLRNGHAGSVGVKIENITFYPHKDSIKFIITKKFTKKP